MKVKQIVFVKVFKIVSHLYVIFLPPNIIFVQMKTRGRGLSHFLLAELGFKAIAIASGFSYLSTSKTCSELTMKNHLVTGCDILKYVIKLLIFSLGQCLRMCHGGAGGRINKVAKIRAPGKSVLIISLQVGKVKVNIFLLPL